MTHLKNLKQFSFLIILFLFAYFFVDEVQSARNLINKSRLYKIRRYNPRFRRQNNNSEQYGSPAAPILNESKTTIATTIPIEINSEEENKYEAPEAKEVLEPQIKSIPDIEENIIIESEEEVKKYVPQVKLVEEPETPPMTTSSTPSTTASQEPSEKEARTYKPITPIETKHESKLKGDDYINPVLDKKFPNFFTRFQKIFGDTRSSFFVKLQ